MGFLDKLAFWKKKDEFEGIGLGDKGQSLSSGLGSPDFGMGTGMEGGYGLPTQPAQPTAAQPMQQPSYPQSYTQPSFQPQFQQSPQQTTSTEKDLEIISSKLDAIRATIDSINQRLANLEAMARGEQEQNRDNYYRY
jgi:hypothetical protein